MDYGSLNLTSRRTGIRPLTKQSKFQGSKRWYRGKLIKELIHSEGMFLEEIEEKYADCSWNIQEIVNDLISEGLVERSESADPDAPGLLKIKES
jgi:A/G-specific adenine glycosylase